jgi:hypothetical protein
VSTKFNYSSFLGVYSSLSLPLPYFFPFLLIIIVPLSSSLDSSASLPISFSYFTSAYLPLSFFLSLPLLLTCLFHPSPPSFLLPIFPYLSIFFYSFCSLVYSTLSLLRFFCLPSSIFISLFLLLPCLFHPFPPSFLLPTFLYLYFALPFAPLFIPPFPSFVSSVYLPLSSFCSLVYSLRICFPAGTKNPWTPHSKLVLQGTFWERQNNQNRAIRQRGIPVALYSDVTYCEVLHRQGVRSCERNHRVWLKRSRLNQSPIPAGSFADCVLTVLHYKPESREHNFRKKKLNPIVWVRERTIQTERPPLVGEVIANFCG